MKRISILIIVLWSSICLAPSQNNQPVNATTEPLTQKGPAAEDETTIIPLPEDQEPEEQEPAEQPEEIEPSIIAPEGADVPQEIINIAEHKDVPHQEEQLEDAQTSVQPLPTWHNRLPEEQPLSMADVDIPAPPTLTQIEKEQAEHEVVDRLTKAGAIYLGSYLEPWKGADPHERVEMNFDNKELSELLKFLSNALDITFILDDYIGPQRADGLQPLAGTKITFKSTVPLTLRQAWEIGLTFIEMAGFSVIPGTQPRTYRVTAAASRDKPSANREPLPTFIGIDPEMLPDTDAKIRYVYFAENAELSTIVQIIENMKSGSAGPLIEVPPLKAVIVTDKAANIRSMMTILKEIDRTTMPEELAIIRLKHTDAREVREIYYRLIGKDPKNPTFNPYARQRKASTTHYFSEETRVFEEPYTNSLIVLGSRENIKRFENFIVKYIDKSIEIPFSPLHIIQLRFIDAGSIAKILNDIIQKFNADPANTAAALVGGVRDGNKFFKTTVRITEEPSGNRLIINADYEDYLKLREIIEKLDVEQPQVAIKMLILNVDLTNMNQLGVQLRNSVACCDGTGGLDSLLGDNVNFQTSMLGPIITRPPAGVTNTDQINGAKRLLGNLIRLTYTDNGVSPFDIGSTLVTLGKDMFGFWGLLRVLETYTRTSVIANPYLVTTHKYKAEFKVGETRRTTSAIVTGQRETQAQGDISADLRIVLTPQISYDDMVALNIYIELGQFINETTQNRIIRKISTEALLANKEVLALGGLIRDRVIESEQKVPVLGNLPLVGWFFKNKSKTVERTSLLILISPEIIKPEEPQVATTFTYTKITDSKDTLYSMRSRSEDRDPIHRWFFRDHKDKEASTIDKFVAMQQRYIDASQRKHKLAQAEQPKPVKRESILDFIDQHEGVSA